MFSPRGALPQRPRGPNPSGAKPPGPFQGGGVTGPQRAPAPGAPRGAAPRASGQDSVPWTGSQRINVRVTLHRADPRQAKAKSNLHQEQKGDVRAGRWDGSPCPPPPVVSQKPPARLPEQKAAAQNRYTPESASSILASFGLSNEDLEELSRYPDDQLTPENMPLILREIRMRKMGHPLPGLHSQSRGEAMSGTSGAAVKGKVIDYGHASKYGYTEDPLEVPRPYNPEAPSAEKREEFQREQSVPMGVPPAGVACGPAFPPQDVMKPPPAFQSDPANPPPFFPPVVPPLISQPVVPILPQPPFSAELLAILEQRDRIQHEAGSSQPSAPSSGMGQKPFQPQPEGPVKSPFGVVKASWLPSFLQSDSQKIKRLPTPSMMNDYYATSPRIFPHMCSLCNVECARMKVSVFKDYCHSCTQLLTRCSVRPRPAGSSYAPRHSRSRSRSPGRYRPSRPRSRSPRQVRRLSPRHWSRSPQRSRNPLRGSPLAAATWKVLIFGVVFNVQLLREELLNCGTVLQISNLPDDGFSDQDIKKIVQPFGKVSDLIVLKVPLFQAYLEMNYKEAVIAAVKYGETAPVLVNGKQVKISVAEKPKASPSKKEKTKKPVGTKEGKPKMTSDTAGHSVILWVSMGISVSQWRIYGVSMSRCGDPWVPMGVPMCPCGGSVCPYVSLGSPAHSRGLELNEHCGPLQFRPSYDPMGLSVSLWGICGSLCPCGGSVCPYVSLGSPAHRRGLEPDDHCDPFQPRPLYGSSPQSALSCFACCLSSSSHPGWRRSSASCLCLQEADDVCVVLVSNLPDKGYSVEEVSNLAKPFGGLRDVLIVSSHKKAYLEINSRSAESMVKFYTCFPMTLDGNQLCIAMAPQHRSVRDEEAIFTALIKDSDPKVNPETVQQQFVHLGNLPEEGYREFEVVCVGLRFGKVDHYVVLKNRNKAILQLESPKAARSMYCFLNQYSYTMGEHTLTCTLSPSRQQADVSFLFSLLPHCCELPGGAAGRADPAPAGTAAPPTAGRTWGAAPKAVPADVASSAVPPRNPKADAAQKSRVNDSVKTEREQQRVPTAELKAEFEAGADGGVEAEVSGGTAAEESCPLPPVQTAAEVERKRERCGAEVGAAGENAAKNGKERTGSLIRAPQSKESRPATTKGAGAAAASDAPSSIKEPSSAAKVVLKAVVSVPDILKPRVAVQRSKPALCKGEERAAPSKARPQGAAAGQRKAALKEEAQPSSSGKAGGGRNASQQQKDSQGEPRAASKQWQDGESRWSGTKKDGSRWVAARCRSVLHPRCSPSQEEELFPFNLDEFVTVDEVMEESESPVKPQRGQPKGKRKECCRCGSEPGSKRRKERSPPQRLADSQLSFVMLDEIGEEEEGEEEGEAGARLGMLVVDEGGRRRRRRFARADFEEGPKQKEEEEEEEGGAEEPCPVPDDPSALVTVDEIHEDNEDGAAAAWEEANDDEDDFLADFNRLKEELNFVTVDEVGEEDEEEESAPPGRNPKEGNRGEETAAEGAEGRTAAGLSPCPAGGRFCRPCGRIPPCSFQMGLRRLSLHCWQPVLHRRDGDGFLLHHAGLHRRMSSCRLHPSRSLRVSLQATAKGSKQKTEEIKHRIIRNTVSRDLSTPTAHCAHTAFGSLTSQR
uniref:RRM domain-containing protein n=1 Tax=Gallus gallus TaxID=9031 RepID=A0A8V0Z6I0_CHICK